MNEPATALVCARGLCKEYGSGEGLVRAVDGVDLEVPRGETLAVMGPSGCGKSTLLHLLGGLDRPSAGELWLAGRRIDRLSERALAHLRCSEVGFVFQAYHLMDELTAQENVELPTLLAGRSPRQAGGAPVTCSNRSASPNTPATFLPCSRVVSASVSPSPGRSSNEPQLVLADEPTGNLDSTATLEVLRLFETLRAAGLTLVIVTHDDRIAATADRLISIRDGAFVDETRLTGGTTGSLADLAGLGG